MSELEKQLSGYRLTTAEILYHMPDRPCLLQSYVWQDYDRAPEFPILHRFLQFWREKLDGRLHSVRVASHELVSPARFRHVGIYTRLH